MNYLAHLLLSGPDRDMQVGGLLGDFVKGPLKGELPTRVEQGIRLHRHIDTLTDGHPAFMAATRRLPGEWRRYRGILLDIYFDHLLACRWGHYHIGTSTTTGKYCHPAPCISVRSHPG